MKKYQDFIPKAEGEKVIWLEAYLKHLRLAIEVTELNMPDNEVMLHEQEVQEYIEAIIDGERTKQAAKAATLHKEELEQTTIKNIRRIAGLIRAKGYKEEGLIAKMGIKCKGYTVNEAELCPEIKVTAAGKKVYVYFNKNHHYNVAVYCRLPGQEFIHIGNGLSSPFVDERPLSAPPQPERREYMLMYTNFKENIGRESTIASVVYGGD